MTEATINTLFLAIINTLIACGITHFLKKALLQYTSETKKELEGLKSKLSMNNFVSQRQYDLEQNSYSNIWGHTIRLQNVISHKQNDEKYYNDKFRTLPISLNNFINQYETLSPFIDESVLNACIQYKWAYKALVKKITDRNHSSFDTFKNDDWSNFVESFVDEKKQAEAANIALMNTIKERMKTIL